ncbi:hypothetical protein BSZ21_00090, partial [Bradyrhizobium canariense]
LCFVFIVVLVVVWFLYLIVCELCVCCLKRKTAYVIGGRLVGAEMCVRDGQSTGACMELATRYQNVAGTFGVARDNH